MNKRIIRLLAYNIRSLWNVGSLFRTCDAFAVEKLFLCGYTALPPRREISKTAIGAEEFVPWEHSADPIAVVREMKKEGYSIVSLECKKRAKSLNEYSAGDKICLIVGNEVLGVPEELIDESDEVIAIKMFGHKESLNVSVAAGIALYHIRN